ncbi:MAG TPA: YtxH domain-containing protein [Pyrinomonadaceae bacterium]|jgi:gas vesicle protein|nr:YtxH domain-containing protein [Pyrinomonadaceae bacterium]
MQNQSQGRRRESGSNASTRLAYLLIGGSIGAAIALLFAPKSGQELRGDLADVTRKGIDRTRETATQVGARAGELAGTARERASELYSTASEKAGELAGTAREAAARRGGHLTAAIEAGKQAYAEEKRRTTLSSATNAAPTWYEREKES